jgi:hypothetical protein
MSNVQSVVTPASSNGAAIPPVIKTSTKAPTKASLAAHAKATEAAKAAAEAIEVASQRHAVDVRGFRDSPAGPIHDERKLPARCFKVARASSMSWVVCSALI